MDVHKAVKEIIRLGIGATLLLLSAFLLIYGNIKSLNFPEYFWGALLIGVLGLIEVCLEIFKELRNKRIDIAIAEKEKADAEERKMRTKKEFEEIEATKIQAQQKNFESYKKALKGGKK